MKNILFLTLCFFVLTKAFCQNDTLPALLKNPEIKESYLNEYMKSSGVLMTFDERYQGIRGTPFYGDRWFRGEIVLKDGNRFTDRIIRLDTWKQEVDYAGNKTEAIRLAKSAVDHIYLWEQGIKKKFLIIRTENDPLGSFYEVLAEGNMSFLALHRKSFIEADYKDPYSANRPYDEFKPGKEYYFYGKGNIEPLRLKIRKKKVLEALDPKHSNSINDFLRDKNNSLKTEEEVIQLIEYYNRLNI